MPKDLRKVLLKSEKCSNQAIDQLTETLARNRGIIAVENEYDLNEKECRRMIIQEARREAKNNTTL